MNLARYTNYKESGIEWLGDIPSHWTVKRLKFLTKESLKYGANVPAELTDPDFPRYVRITDVDTNGNLKEDTFRSIEPQIAQAYLLQEGDILFARSGATVGKSFIYKKSWGIAAYAGYLIRARINERLFDPKFLYYTTRSDGYNQWIESITIQATIQNVSAEKYSSLYFSVPPNLQEQQSIAEFLDTEVSRIDTLIAKKQQFIECLKEKRLAVISNAVSKGIDPNAELKSSGVEWLGDIPKAWNVKPIKYFCTVNDETLSEASDPTTEILYVDIGSVDPTKGIVKKDLLVFEDAPSRARRIVKSGDIIVSTVRTYLRAIAPIENAEENLIVSTGFAVVRPRQIEADFLSFFLRSKYFVEAVVSRSVGVSYPAINASVLASIKIASPSSKKEQKEIAEYLKKETSKMDLLIEKTELHIDKLQEYKTAFISAAVTGKIKVTDQA